MEQNLDSRTERGDTGPKLELGLVLTSGFLNTVVVVIFGAQQAAFPGTAWQNLFPFPLLYFIEIIALSAELPGDPLIAPCRTRWESRWLDACPDLDCHRWAVGVRYPGWLLDVIAPLFVDFSGSQPVPGHADY